MDSKVQIVRKKHKELTRPVIRIVGVWTTVKGYGTVDEPVGRFDAWTNTAFNTQHYNQLLKEGKKLKATIKFDKNDQRWYVTAFNEVEPEIETTAEEQRKEWIALGNDY